MDQESCPTIGLLADQSTDKSPAVQQRRRVLIIFAATMGMIGIVTAIVLAFVYGGFPANAAPQPKVLEGITLDEVLQGKFYAESFNGTWISDTEFSYRTAAGGISIYNVETTAITVVLQPNDVAELKVATYKISPDRQHLLYSFGGRQSYRYSNLARYSVINLGTKTVYQLHPTLESATDQPYLSYATWNKQGNGIVYVYLNNIFFRQNPNQSGTLDAALTIDGDPEGIFNGIPDWVYEEEVLYQDNAIWLSKNGNRMVFGTFDDHQVDRMEFSMYGEPSSTSFQYPITQSMRYPKAGRTNPTIKLSSNTFGNSSTVLQPPSDVPATDYYFTTVAWSTDNEVMIAWLNRHQNVSQLSFCDTMRGVCQTEHTVTDPNGWVDLTGSPIKFSSNGRKFLILLPRPQAGDAGNFKHIVLHDRDLTGAEQQRALTSGRWEVTEILGWDEINQIAYFVGTATDKPAVRHLYKVSTGAAGNVICVTCNTVNADGKECTYNSIEFSTNLKYYVHGCDGPNAPRSVIKATADDREVFLVTENVALREKIAQKAMPRVLNMQVPLDGNYFAQVRLFLPPSLNRNRASQYPMLVYVYGGPHSQQVSDRFRVDWGYHLASSRGVIYALIDGRGSGFQGDKMMQEIYRKMGTVEIQDQIRVAKFLRDNLPFVDGNRTAIWGWSYGGFATASALVQDTENVFKCGMSVAPVTNWIYYDSIYTERYMGLPTEEDNLKAYEESDVCKHAEAFRGKKYYLIHGTADDNVHYQQSLMLGKALEEADVLFRQQSYTDENHSIGSYRKHLYHSLGTFLMTDCFGVENEIWG